LKKFQRLKKLLKVKWLLEIVFIAIFLIGVILHVATIKEAIPNLKTAEFQTAIKEGKVDHVTFQRGAFALAVVYKDGREFTTINLSYDGFLKDLTAMGLEDIRIQSGSNLVAFSGILTTTIFLMFAYILIKGFSGIFGSVNKTLNRADKINNIDAVNVTTFADVAGMSEEKAELISAIESIRPGNNLRSKGMRPIKGVLLGGPPGVGKTLLAKAIAGEAGVKFLSFSGAGFNEMYVGVGAMRVRQMYKQAVENSPCVVFIDEIDSVGLKRSNNPQGGEREHNNTLTALLEKMDGVGTETGILFVGATNRLETLDPALTRPGRFDKIITIGPPKSKEDREAIVTVHMKGKAFKEDVTAERIGKLCYGLTGAQIEAALNDAIMESFKHGDDGVIDLPHIDNAIMKLELKGVAKGKHTGKHLERVAVHEIGHAMMYQKVGKRVIKVAVQPYTSGVGGVTMVDGDTNDVLSLMTRQDFKDQIKVLYAGMVAEQVILGDYSNGNSNDLERATQLLHHMVAFLGMEEGSILSASYLSNFGNSPMVSDEVLAKMEVLGATLRQEVTDYFSEPHIKDRIITLAKELADNEVIYDLPEQTFDLAKV
jgi:cell division protease FtsH